MNEWLLHNMHIINTIFLGFGRYLKQCYFPSLNNSIKNEGMLSLSYSRNAVKGQFTYSCTSLVFSLSPPSTSTFFFLFLSICFLSHSLHFLIWRKQRLRNIIFWIIEAFLYEKITLNINTYTISVSRHIYATWLFVTHVTYFYIIKHIYWTSME